LALTIFLDTSVLLAGLVDFGPQSAPAQSILHAVAEKTLPSPGTAWHCCLEFYSVATRLPPEFRLTPEDANELLRQEVFGRLVVHDLPSAEQGGFFDGAARERIAGARVIVTDNRRHFVSALRHGIKVETPSEFLASIKTKRG
jgi:hypothetical protein